jgi:hypothetical protein
MGDEHNVPQFQLVEHHGNTVRERASVLRVRKYFGRAPHVIMWEVITAQFLLWTEVTDGRS